VQLHFFTSLRLFSVEPVVRLRGALATVWGDLFSRPVCGLVRSAGEREANNSRHNTVQAFAIRHRSGCDDQVFYVRIFRRSSMFFFRPDDNEMTTIIITFG
jgi:hypothetical protein